VGTWTKDYKAFLDELCSAEIDGKPFLKGFDDLYNDLDVKFILYLDADYYEDVKADPDDFVKKFKMVSTWKTSNMNCFDTNCKIVKYDTPGDILEAFYSPRLVAYEQRRLKEMERLEHHMLECDAKARFLRLVLDGTIDLRRKEDDEIVALMKSCSLPPLSKPEQPDSVDAFDYLLRLRIDRVKKAAIVEAEQSLIAARIAFETLRDTTASALWLTDLADFEKAWTAMKAHREQVLAGAVSATPVKKRKFKVVDA
jgi:DNA topoisomerase-2